METELHKLRIEKGHRASRDASPVGRVAAIAAVALVVLVVILLWVYRLYDPPMVVKTIRVHPVEMSGTVQNDLVALNATGYVTAAHKVELASKVVGKVAWVGVEMGDTIKKGQELVRLEDDEYKAQVATQQGILDNAKAKLAELEAGSRPQEIAQAQAMVDQAESELANARINADRLRTLKDTRSVSQQQIDDADSLVRSRAAQVESQKQQLDMARIGPRKEEIDAQRATVHQLEGGLSFARIQLDDTVIRAPFDATVLERNVEVGEFVTTGFVGDKGAKGYVLSIADLKDLRVELDVSQNDIAKVKGGASCTIATDAYPDRKYRGIVDLISPEANRQKATVLVRVKVIEPDALIKPDMNATVAFLSSSTSGATQPNASSSTAIRIPASAIHDGVVFIVEDGRAVRKPITPGLSSSGGDIEIRQGLIGGEDLIVSPPETLKEGDRVTIDSEKN